MAGVHLGDAGSGQVKQDPGGENPGYSPGIWRGIVKARVIAASVTSATAWLASRVRARRRLLPHNEVTA
jgi:hypothetical protein